MAFTHTINVFVFYCREGQIDKAKGFSSCKWLLLLQHRTGVGARECVGWVGGTNYDRHVGGKKCHNYEL